jgi:ATPase involved in DNA repair/ATPase family associated with various cellular activities (AAA)
MEKTDSPHDKEPVQNTINATEQNQIDSGTYEVIRQRLDQCVKQLRETLDKVNKSRKDVFGAVSTTLISSERITTENSCIPRDLASFGNRFIFGYNVQFGLRSTTCIEDVFSVYDYDNHHFNEVSIDIIKNDNFVRDFQELYKYYKNTFLTKLVVNGPFLYMVFRTGSNVSDIKTFKWGFEKGNLVYFNNRSEQELITPPQHEFEWKRTRRESFRTGQHPHISIEDRLFVETIGGDLTIKVEDNTSSGRGIYSESVDNKDQTLDDAEIFYAIVGNLILLKIRPFQEKDFRYLLFNEKTQKVLRIDTIEDACILLPDNSGIIFPNGYYLQTGVFKIFDSTIKNLRFEKKIIAPNGEDFQFVFYNAVDGIFVILPYNRIEQKVDTPVICHGYTYFDNGEQILFKAEKEPRNSHVLQIWQTPFFGTGYIPPAANTDSLLYKIGNKEVVRCMSECQTVLSLLQKEDSYANLYIDITRESNRILDSHFWIDKPEGYGLKDTLVAIRTIAASAVEEFEKVNAVKKQTRDALSKVTQRSDELLLSLGNLEPKRIDRFVSALADIRSLRGDITSLKEMKYTDLEAISILEKSAKNAFEKISSACIAFLLTPDGLRAYHDAVIMHDNDVNSVTKTSDGRKVEADIDKTGMDLELLVEIVGNLKIDDPVNATQITEKIALIFGELNRIRSRLRMHLKNLRSGEGAAEFNAQIKLLDQSIANYLDIANNISKCDEFLSKTMVLFEELDSRFADFDEFVPVLAQKRIEVNQAFESKRVMLQEQRNRVCTSLMSAAERILQGIETRLHSFTTQNDINTYFASDMMVDKVRELIEKLDSLGDTVKADDIQSRLKTLHEDASRKLLDSMELYVDGKDIIKLGRHNFSVNNQPLDLAIIYKNEQMYFHLTGTDFYESIVSEELETTKNVWAQELISENTKVYRAEYLAYQIIKASKNGNFDSMESIAASQADELTVKVSKFMTSRYDEGYVKGVHDFDAALIIKNCAELSLSIDLLTCLPSARALARLFWLWPQDQEIKDRIDKQLKGMHVALTTFSKGQHHHSFIDELLSMVSDFCKTVCFCEVSLASDAVRYLCDERGRGNKFVISIEADTLCRKVTACLKEKVIYQKFVESVNLLSGNPAAQFEMVHNWIRACFSELNVPDLKPFIEEAAVLIALELITGLQVRLPSEIVETPTSRTIKGLRGDHPKIVNGEYILTYALFLHELSVYERDIVLKFQTCRDIKRNVCDSFKKRLKLDEFNPKIMSSFVRNKLINELYLPLIGDNLAKQIGVVGEKKRTDLMGMLLLISPPGYGKTTLMEYVASRVGLIFMKINGPAVGNKVTSLDPAEAPNASSREELQKLNLALEMGNNVMIYVDDIQHCNPEFLEKFISLCDAQRKIEGVYNGKSRTYDFRGKKVAVVMAGNPYTESGERFKIPDMLANRADTYNLGDMLSANEKAFKLSYIENALTSNPVLSEMTKRPLSDLYAFVNACENNSMEKLELSGDYNANLMSDLVSVIRKLLTVRDIVLKVNQEYIRSAAQANEYRIEPAFKLQGSYRNMNRIAERIVPVMNDEELFGTVVRSYENDAQTLTTGAESNLLKWKELQGCLKDTERTRWEEIKRSFNQNKFAKADDKVGQAVLQLCKFGDGLSDISNAIAKNKSSPPQIVIQEKDPKNQVSEASITKIVKELTDVLTAGMDKVAASLQGADASGIDIVNPEPMKSVLSVLENQMNIMQEWLKYLQSENSERMQPSSENSAAPDAYEIEGAEKSGTIAALETTINRSLWFQRELIARFLKEERDRKRQEKRKSHN